MVIDNQYSFYDNGYHVELQSLVNDDFKFTINFYFIFEKFLFLMQVYNLK